MFTLSKTRLAISVLIIIAVISTIASTVAVFNLAQNRQINSLRSRVSTLALTIDTNDIKLLAGSEADIGTTPYENIKSKLTNLKQVNSDIKFVYLMSIQDKEVIFLADSEPEDSEDYSPPGQVYDEVTPILYNSFRNQGPMQEVSSDRWGKWLSVFAPITDQATGEVVAIAGFDMPYESYLISLIFACAIPVSIGLILIILLVGAWIVAKKDENLLHIRSEYISIAAHDLRTPLTGIKWAVSSLVNSKPTAPPHYQTTLKQITKTADNMIISVNELLDGSALESGKVKKLVIAPLKLQEIIQTAFKPLEMSAQEKAIAVEWNIPKKSITIHGDNDKLRRVFANLFSNAIKYSKNKGKIVVAIEEKNDKAIISVTDSGIGIPKGEQNAVFEGYFRASNAKEHTSQGTGLGLYYVKNVISSHGGQVNLASKPGKGTVVTITLPVIKTTV